MAEDIESQLAKYAQAVSWLRHRYIMDDEAHLITITQGPSQPDLSQALLQVGIGKACCVCNRNPIQSLGRAWHHQGQIWMWRQQDALSSWHTAKAACYAKLILLAVVCLCQLHGKHTD